MKTVSELCKDAEQFLMIYGGPSSRRVNRLIGDLRAPSDDSLKKMQKYLLDFYGNVAVTKLTGADGLDMDEAYAARLYREISVVLQPNQQ